MPTDQQLLDIYSPEFWANETLAQLYKSSQMINLVNRDFSAQVAVQGELVNTRIPGKVTASDHQSGVFNSANPDADNVQVKLDKWKETPAISIDDKVASMSLLDLTQLYIQPMAESIVEAVETDLIAEYKNFYAYTGVAGTTPNSVALLGTNPAQMFDDLLIPKSQRRIVWSSAAANQYRQQFWQAQQVGNTNTLITGALGPLFGQDNFDSQYSPTHATAAGWTGGTGAQVNANTNPSATGLNSQTLAIKGLNTGTLNKGDIFTIDHGGAIGVKSYTLLADATITTNVATCSIAPILAAAVTTNQAITVIATHRVNLGFHRDAVTLASRPLALPRPGIATGQIAVANYNGLGIRSQIWYDNKDKKTYAQMDILYGIKTLDARRGFRILG